jgi:hypothetical protein
MKLAVRKLEIDDLDTLHTLVIENIDAVEAGLSVLDSRLLLGQATIDIVALDRAGALVLFSVGFTADEEMLLRAVEAYSWCLEYPEAIHRLYPAAQLSDEHPPRLVFVIARMPDAFHRKIKQLGFPAVDCVEFRYFDVGGTPAVYFETLAQVRRPALHAVAPQRTAPAASVATVHHPVAAPSPVAASAPDPAPVAFAPAPAVAERVIPMNGTAAARATSVKLQRLLNQAPVDMPTREAAVVSLHRRDNGQATGNGHVNGHGGAAAVAATLFAAPALVDTFVVLPEPAVSDMSAAVSRPREAAPIVPPVSPITSPAAPVATPEPVSVPTRPRIIPPAPVIVPTPVVTPAPSMTTEVALDVDAAEELVAQPTAQAVIAPAPAEAAVAERVSLRDIAALLEPRPATPAPVAQPTVEARVSFADVAKDLGLVTAASPRVAEAAKIVERKVEPVAPVAPVAPAAPAAQVAPPAPAAKASPLPQEFDGLKFPNDGVLTRQWLEFLNQMAATK